MLSLPELAFFMTVLIIPNGFHKTIRRGFEYSCRFLKAHWKHKTRQECFDDSCRHSLTDRILILHVAHTKKFTKAPYRPPWVPHRDIKQGKPYPLTRPRPAPILSLTATRWSCRHVPDGWPSGNTFLTVSGPFLTVFGRQEKILVW